MIIKLSSKYLLGNEEFVPVCITKPGNAPVMGYTNNGSMYEFDINGKSLVGCIHLQELKLYDNFKIDEPVMCRDSEDDIWQRGHFAGIDSEGSPKMWGNGTTQWSSDDYAVSWMFCCKNS